MGTMNMFVLTTLSIFALCAQWDPMLRIDPCVTIHDLRWDIPGKLSPIDPTWFLDWKLHVTPFPPSVGSGSLDRFGASKNPLQWYGGPSSLLFLLWFLILAGTWFGICMNVFTCFFD